MVLTALTDIKSQLQTFQDLVFDNDTDFIKKLCPTTAYEEITDFHINAESCKVVGPIESGSHAISYVTLTSFIEWVNQLQNDKPLIDVHKVSDADWAFVTKTLDLMKETTQSFTELTRNIQLAPESPLITPIHTLETALMESLGVILKDGVETIEWYIYECSYGDNPMKAGVDKNMRLIDSHDALRWLIDTTNAPIK
jgi:hypothetical protein